MSLTRTDILDLARRYVADSEVADFPLENDLFALLVRHSDTTRDGADDTGWSFGGYGLCLGYEPDTDSKPEGKWVWMKFASLLAYPLKEEFLKLQPPHIARGRFFSSDRSQEVRIVKVKATAVRRQAAPEEESAARNARAPDPKILQFRTQRRS